jgi:hypothetical protein
MPAQWMVGATTFKSTDAYLAPGKSMPIFGYGYLLWLLLVVAGSTGCVVNAEAPSASDRKETTPKIARSVLFIRASPQNDRL